MAVQKRSHTVKRDPAVCRMNLKYIETLIDLKKWMVGELNEGDA
jgi:hypothetical protein